MIYVHDYDDFLEKARAQETFEYWFTARNIHDVALANLAKFLAQE